MYENIGSCFSTLRKSKHIPVSSIVGDNISNSQYHRFVNNESDVSLTKFLYMVDQVNMTLEEFSVFAFSGSESSEQGMKDIKEAFDKKDLNLLRNLSVKYEEIYKSDHRIKFQHLSFLCDALIGKIEKSKSVSPSSLELKQYLTNIRAWGHYELTLFNHSFFLFDETTIYNFFKHVKDTPLTYQPKERHAKDLIKFYSNIVIYFIERNRIDLAKEVIEEFSKVKLETDQVYEKSIIKFWLIVRLYISGDKQTAIRQMTLLQQFYHFINNEKYGLRLKEVFEFIQEKIDY